MKNQDTFLKKSGLLLFCLLLCFSAAGIGGFATSGALTDWYVSLNKPVFNPPNWVFGPAWTLLYTLMAISLYLVIRADHPSRKFAIAVFAFQLLLNTLWSFLFFYFQMIDAALFEIIAMLITLIIYYRISLPVHKTAARLFIPYIAWVSFATLLNLAICYLN